MKIAVVSTGRSRCTLLAKYLHAIHPDFEFCKEFYTEASRDGDYDVIKLTTELLSKEDFVVKIMAGNLIEGYSVSDFKLEEYDEIYLAERHDFFEQACSWYIARTYGAYHLWPDLPASGPEKFDIIRRHRSNLPLQKIKDYAKYVDTYLKMKQYLVDHGLEFTLYTYESIKQFDEYQDTIRDSNLNYSELITNYQLKEEVNNLFNKYFSYENMTGDLESFNRELENVAGLRSLGSFANKMTSLWNK